MDHELLGQMTKRRIWITIGVAAVLIAAIAVLTVWKNGGFLPGWISWNSTEIDGGDSVRIVLSGRQVRVMDGDTTVWQSDRAIRVQDALWCDIDHDQAPELLLLCWKRGRYGESRPFWVTEDEQSWSQHIFLYDWTGEGVRPIWMASDIGMEAVGWQFDETRRLIITDRQGRETAWDWVSWGLSKIELLPDTAALTFAALGDNLIHRQIYEYAFRHFDGCFDDLFAGVRDELSRYDVTSLNQETIYVDDPAEYSDYPLFGTPLEVGEAVVRAGFDVVSCATNHALDKGTAAIDLTAAFYAENGVLCAGIQPSTDGAYRPYALLEKNGITCAVFSYTETTNGHKLPEEAPYALHTLDDEQQVRADLLLGREAADVSIVYVHWGTEYAETPDENQRYWAQIFADCGVDVVIGTHPHVVQPYEWATGADGHETLVFYSLGNFISAQTGEACRHGGLAYFTVTKENGQCSVTDYGLKTLVTEEDNGHYSTRVMDNDTDDLK